MNFSSRITALPKSREGCAFAWTTEWRGNVEHFRIPSIRDKLCRRNRPCVLKPTSAAEPMIHSWFPEQVLDCAQEFFRVQRLLQQRACAGSRCDGKLIRQARHDDRRHVWISPRDVFGCRPPVLARHIEVQKQQINWLREETINGFKAVSGEGDVVVSLLQQLLQPISDGSVIIDNQNALFHDSFVLNRVHPRSARRTIPRVVRAWLRQPASGPPAGSPDTALLWRSNAIASRNFQRLVEPS